MERAASTANKKIASHSLPFSLSPAVGHSNWTLRVFAISQKCGDDVYMISVECARNNCAFATPTTLRCALSPSLSLSLTLQMEIQYPRINNKQCRRRKWHWYCVDLFGLVFTMVLRILCLLAAGDYCRTVLHWGSQSFATYGFGWHSQIGLFAVHVSPCMCVFVCVIRCCTTAQRQRISVEREREIVCTCKTMLINFQTR